MGFCFSCCRRSRTQTGDREPLLPRQAENAEPLLPSQYQVNKLADVLAALRAGKLPSQDQTNAALRRLLHSDVLAVEGSKSARVLGQGQQYGPLSGRGQTILKDFREVIEAIVQFGLEKNDDDRIQDLIYQNARMGTSPITVKPNAAASDKTVKEVENLESMIPPQEELDEDVHQLSRSVFTLSRLLLTSSAFRLLLSDILLTSREMLADAVANVGRVARTVELKAETVEETVRPEDKQVDPEELRQRAKSDLGHIADETKSEWEKLGNESPDRLKETVLERLQKTISQAQQTPAYNSALSTLLYLLRKYVEKSSAAGMSLSSIASSVTATPVITADPHLARALTDLRMILERLASGRSLSPLITCAEMTLREIVSENSSPTKSELRDYFDEIGEWLDKGLADSSFATSIQGRQSAERLYDRGREVMLSEENEPWVKDARKLLDEVDVFTHALASDRTTRRITDSLEKLSAHSTGFTKAAVGASLNGQKVWREEAKRDIIGWVIPRVLRMLKTIPMPRVEVKSGALELAIDSILLTAASASFVPDHAVVQNWSEIRLEASAAVLDSSGVPLPNGAAGGVTTFTRTRIHIDGLRIAAHQIGYYVKYTGPLGGLISWEDNGLMSLDIGAHNASGEGLAVDIEVETSPAHDEDSPVFLVNDVQVDLPGLDLSIDNSRHWIFNKLLLQPLAGPVMRRVIRSIFASQIRAGLENLNERMTAVRKGAHERAGPVNEQGPSVEEYWEALLGSMEPSSEDEDDEEAENAPFVDTDTHLTLKGVVRSTITQPAPDASTPPTPSETVVAVGIGAQILPGKGGPQSDVRPVADQARDALTDLGDAAENAVGKAKDAGTEVTEAAVMAREELEGASERMANRLDVERRKKGWRSRAFDL